MNFIILKAILIRRNAKIKMKKNHDSKKFQL